MPWMAVAAAAPIVTGAIGAAASSGDRAKSVELAQQAYQQLQNLGLPPDTAKELILEKYQQAGLYTPELEQTISMGPSAMQSVQVDPEIMKAQTGALSLLQQRTQTGLTPEDRLSFKKLEQESQADQQAKMQQIMQNMRSRGMGGQGAEIAAQLGAAQSGAQQQSMRGDQIAAAASQNALQAALSSGQLGTQLQQQGLGLAQNKASAADQIAQFNALQAIAAQRTNVGAKNTAQQQNLSSKQAVSNANVNQANLEKQRQMDAQRQYYDSILKRAQLQAGGAKALSDTYADQAEQTGKVWSGIGTGVAQGAGAMAGKK